MLQASVDLPKINKNTQSNHVKTYVKKEKIILDDKTTVEATFEKMESSIYGHGGIREATSQDFSRIICMSCDYHCNTMNMFCSHRCKNVHAGSVVDVACVFKCGKTFKSHAAKSTHERYCENDQRRTCDLCGSEFSNTTNLKEHRKKCSHIPHDKRTVFKCEKCKKQFTRYYNYYMHIQYCKGIQDCPICEKTLIQKDFDKHLKRCQNDHKCNICVQAFQSWQLFLQHMRKMHAGQKLFPCNFCKFTFVKEDHCLAHIAHCHQSEFNSPEKK